VWSRGQLQARGATAAAAAAAAAAEEEMHEPMLLHEAGAVLWGHKDCPVRCGEAGTHLALVDATAVSC
jgi:hypothetical protein